MSERENRLKAYKNKGKDTDVSSSTDIALHCYVTICAEQKLKETGK